VNVGTDVDCINVVLLRLHVVNVNISNIALENQGGDVRGLLFFPTLGVHVVLVNFSIIFSGTFG